ncbi:TA system VapC family ribonuclease toxin [Ornithinimicrobium sp. Y1847]|uniref:TA system VapC family ribonuclease toxin n=1 Tax=unclassified Ornithinimicrobium TaxID=2615080 RepID=UPI003B679E55
MSRHALLDVNVLLALLDSDHLDHGRATAWLRENIEHGWSSCAITENGFVRIISQSRYPSPVAPASAISLLADAMATDHHRRLPCDVAITDGSQVDPRKVHGPKQITDSYLVALAHAHGGRFVTFDRAVVHHAGVGVTDGTVEVI